MDELERERWRGMVDSRMDQHCDRIESLEIYRSDAERAARRSEYELNEKINIAERALRQDIVDLRIRVAVLGFAGSLAGGGIVALLQWGLAKL